MPEPVKILQCECGALHDRPDAGCPECKSTNYERLELFSEGDMQAVQEERDAALRERDRAVETRENANAVSVRVEGENEQLKRRAAVVAEALRETLDRASNYVKAVAAGAGQEAAERLTEAMDLGMTALAGVPRSHELVPLGTQDALRELWDDLHDCQPGIEEATYAKVKALVEGVEESEPRSIDRDTVRAVIAAAAMAKPCTFLKGFAADPQWRINDPLSPDGLNETLVSEVCERLEGVERTHTPEPLVPGAAARADALACSRCGGLPAGEASGAGDLCVCAQAPTSSVPDPPPEADFLGHIDFFDGVRTHNLTIGVAYGDREDETFDVLLDPHGKLVRHPFEGGRTMSTEEERAAVGWTW
jgi:hypothetical protein